MKWNEFPPIKKQMCQWGLKIETTSQVYASRLQANNCWNIKLTEAFKQKQLSKANGVLFTFCWQVTSQSVPIWWKHWLGNRNGQWPFPSANILFYLCWKENLRQYFMINVCWHGFFYAVHCCLKDFQIQLWWLIGKG